MNSKKLSRQEDQSLNFKLMYDRSPLTMKDIAKIISEFFPCNCELDKWEPTIETGHSCVCRVHKILMDCTYIPNIRSLVHRWNVSIDEAKSRYQIIRHLVNHLKRRLDNSNM